MFISNGTLKGGPETVVHTTGSWSFPLPLQRPVFKTKAGVSSQKQSAVWSGELHFLNPIFYFNADKHCNLDKYLSLSFLLWLCSDCRINHRYDRPRSWHRSVDNRKGKHKKGWDSKVILKLTPHPFCISVNNIVLYVSKPANCLQ